MILKKTEMKSILIIVAIFMSGLINAQDTIETAKTIESQFDNLYKKSSSYQDYKVIRKELFQSLKLQTLDSIGLYKKLLSEETALLQIEKQKLNSLKAQESDTKTALKNAIQNENTISLFGSPISKTNYNLFLWSLILMLFFSLLYFIFKYKNNIFLTNAAKKQLIEVEEELANQRKKALEREQKLRRQLQDEINKQRNV
jgi:hypothetical protein